MPCKLEPKLETRPGWPPAPATPHLLSVSPLEEDHACVAEATHGDQWELHSVQSLAQALEFLRNRPAEVVICERDLIPGTWRDLLETVQRSDAPPLVIVTSRLADEYLWAEVLNLGGYDVLAKPFDMEEMRRVLDLARERARDMSTQMKLNILQGGGKIHDRSAHHDRRGRTHHG